MHTFWYYPLLALAWLVHFLAQPGETNLTSWLINYQVRIALLAVPPAGLAFLVYWVYSKLKPADTGRNGDVIADDHQEN